MELLRAREAISEMQTSLRPDKGKLILVSFHHTRHLTYMLKISVGRFPPRRSTQLRGMHGKIMVAAYVSVMPYRLVSPLKRSCNRLPDCGHVFCQTCLQDWFNTTLAHFSATHPHYDANNPVLHLQAFPRALQAAAYQQAPQYTCPTCRAIVQNRPVEVFALKALVRTVATAVGESSPAKPPAVPNLRAGKNRVQGVQAVVQAVGPWDRFFPRRM
jgi:hypothetical protein